MLRRVRIDQDGPGRRSMIGDSVAAYLADRFQAGESRLAGLDRWSIERISRENSAKVELVEAARDPVEHCFQNLVREIDTEAQAGIFLPNHAGQAARTVRCNGLPCIVGHLNLDVPRIAPTLFPDEAGRSGSDLDLVWVTIHARFDRAQIEAETSELILLHLSVSEDEAADIVDELRAVFYAYHEDRIRRSYDLAGQLDERSAALLLTKVTDLANRAGSYAERTETISRRAGTG